MLAWTGLVPRGWRAMKVSSHSVLANIAELSDLESYGKLEPL